MKLNIFKNKSINTIRIWIFEHKESKRSSITRRHINALYEYHAKNTKFDFSPVRNKKLTEILIYASKNCPYYKNRLPNVNQIKTMSDAVFNSIPLLTKDLIRNNIKDLKSLNIPESCLTPIKTSGSSGNPLAFWSSGNTDPLHQEFLFKLYNYEPGDKILALDGTFLDDHLTEKGIFWKIKNNGYMLPYGGMALSALYLNKNTIHAYVDFILSYKPDFIRGYPAFITEIAKYIVSNNISVDFQMKGIELTSEIILSSQLNIIGKVFHTKVFGQYGHKEACVFGYTSDDSFTYYCSPLYGLTEVLNDKDQHVAIGEEGEIVVTGFSNLGMPFIRYKTGDRALYGGEENGIVKLNMILGRLSNYIYNESAEKKLMVSFNWGLRCNALNRISQWQIIQNALGELIVNIHSINGYSQNDEDEILQFFQKAGKIKCNFIYNEEFIKTEAGKVNFVVQNVII